MKAEQIIEQYDFFFNSHGENVDRHVISAMKEYARIQIEKDRERIKYLLTEHLSTHVSGNIPCCLNSINETPIILD